MRRETLISSIAAVTLGWTLQGVAGAQGLAGNTGQTLHDPALGGSPPSAEWPSPSPTAPPGIPLARARFEAGRSLEKARRFKDAILAFDESQRLDPEPGTLANIATCYDELGDVAHAWISYKEAARLALAAGRTAWATRAEDRAGELQRSAAKVLIELPKAVDLDALWIAIDGMTFPKTLWGEAVPCGAGQHEIRATATAHGEWSSRFDVSARETITVVMPPFAAETALPSTAPAIAGRGRSLDPMRVAAATMGGASLVALVSGVTLAVVSGVTYSASSSKCARACAGNGAALRSQAIGEIKIADMAFVLGGATLLSAATLWWSPHHVRVAPEIGRNEVSLVAGGEW